VTGHHVFNAADLYGEMLDAVAAIEARDEADLARCLKGLAANPQIRRQMSNAALAYAARQGSALETVMDAVLPLVDA